MHPTSATLAIHQLQNIFPTLILPNLDHTNLSFLDKLNSITNSIPVPGEHDLNATLSTMRQIMDQQEYKYQKSLLTDNNETEMMIFDEDCSYEQCSTGVMMKKETMCMQYDNCKPSFVDTIWNWKGEKQSQQPKEQYYYFFD